MPTPSGEPLGRLSHLLLGIITHVKRGFVVVTLKPNNSHLSRGAPHLCAQKTSSFM